jgi:hypothetical protein
MESILLIISVGLLGAGLFVFEAYTEVMEAFLNFKPFNCVFCLTFWASTIFFFFAGYPVYYGIISAFIAEMSYRKLVEGA